MKNIKVLLFVVVASFFASCEDAIDIIQPSELLPEDTYETVGDLQLGLNGAYAAIPGENHILFTSLFTDEVKLGKANGGQGQDGELAFILNNTSGDASSIWVSNYYAINLANRLIAGAENVVPVVDPANDIDETDTYNNILAQAHYIRAFAHFQLLTFFSTDLTNDSALGVILVDFVPTTVQRLPRNTNGEVFALIESDLEFADTNIDDNLVTENYVNNTGASKAAILAFRARMALYRGQLELANSYVDLIPASATLTNKATYPNMFKDAIAGEAIWKLARSVNGATGNFYQFWSSLNTTVSGSPFFEVSTALWNLIPSADVRRSVITDPTSAPSFTVRPVAKYGQPGNAYTQNLNADVKVFRKSEMRLIKAEYFASQDNFAGVATEVNRIRAARFGSAAGNIAVPTTSQEAWFAILNERRIELAFEGHRYIDLKRLGVASKANTTVDRTESDFSWNNAYDIPITDDRWTLPIPRDEQAANPNIQQNPGYGQ
jgi:hypothetical protein